MFLGFHFTKLYCTGCRDGALVRAIASHQCGPGSIPRSGIICGLSLLVLHSAQRVSPGTLVSSLLKNPKPDLICAQLIVNFQFTVYPISAPALERLDT